jgi:NAD(P)-dependent dehydrogenase (short-subunit alcohol dehydrogenase family)
MGKAALHMFTEVLAAEFGPSGVRVNAVAPGYTFTPALKDRIDRGQRDASAMISKSALRRLVEPREVADAIFFLCSDHASAICGATLAVDCGWLAYSAYSSYASQPTDDD